MKNTLNAAIKAIIPTAAEKTIDDVAATFLAMTYDEVISMDLGLLRKIKGIGPKYAEKLYASRMDLAPQAPWGMHGSNPVSPMTRRKKVEFNQNWDPAKQSLAMMLKTQDTATIQSDLDRFVLGMGVEPEDAYFVFAGYIAGSEKETKTNKVVTMLECWKTWCLNGIKRAGHKYRVLLHGTNAGRKTEVLFVRDDLQDAVLDYVSNGGKLDTLGTEAKLLAYFGLKMPGTTSVKDWLGVSFEPENVALFQSWNKVWKDQHVDYVDIENKTVSLDVIRDVVVNIFDGQAVMHFSRPFLKKKWLELPEENRPRFGDFLDKVNAGLRRLGNHTGRGAGFKYLAIVDFDIHQYLHDRKIDYVVDKFGRKLNIDDVVLFGDNSIMKFRIGENGQFNSWDEFCANWHRLGHTFQVLIREHADRPHNLPFQQVQSMIGASSETVQELCDMEVEFLLKYTNPNKAANLLGGDAARLAKAVPAFHRLDWAANREAQAWAKMRAQAMGSTMHGITHNVFLGMDPVAFAQHVEWWANGDLQAKYPDVADYATGFIPENTAMCRVVDGSEAVLSRNPSTDAQAQCVMSVIKDFGEYERYFAWSTLAYLSVRSYEIRRICGDCDGDHGCLCEKPQVIKAAKEANEFCGGRLILWDVPSAAKHAVTVESMRNHCAGLTKMGPTGQTCDSLTSLVGFGPKGYSHEVACWRVMEANLYIDAAKDDGEQKQREEPDFVTDFMTVKDKDGNPVLDEFGRAVKRPMPIYAMQSKDSRHPSAEKKVGNKRCARKLGHGNGDELYNAVNTRTPGKLTVDLEGVSDFDVNAFLIDREGLRNGGNSFGLRGCDELFANGTYNKETGLRENEGLWKQLVFERMNAIRELQAGMAESDGEARSAASKSLEAFKRYAGIRRLTEWAESHDKTFEDVYDAITFWTLKQLKMPVQGKNELDEEFQRRVQAYNIKVEGWLAILGGVAVRTVYERQKFLNEGGAIEDMEAVLDDMTDELF